MINKKIVIACGISLGALTALPAITANAANSLNNDITVKNANPFYITGQAGYVATHLSEKNEGALTDNDGLAYRLAAGYKFNKNFAVETGYFRINSHNINNFGDEALGISINQSAIDVLGKFSVPVSNNVSLYGKVGAAYLVTDISKNAGTELHINSSKHTIAPEVAAGINFDISNDMSVDTSLTHIQPVSSSNIGNIDYLSVGLKYNFG